MGRTPACRRFLPSGLIDWSQFLETGRTLSDFHRELFAVSMASFARAGMEPKRRRSPPAGTKGRSHRKMPSIHLVQGGGCPRQFAGPPQTAIAAAFDVFRSGFRLRSMSHHSRLASESMSNCLPNYKRGACENLTSLNGLRPIRCRFYKSGEAGENRSPTFRS